MTMPPILTGSVINQIRSLREYLVIMAREINRIETGTIPQSAAPTAPFTSLKGLAARRKGA